MTQQEAFLAAIAEARDDGPRLIYADWLEENGDPERAEFIRVQVALHATWTGDRGELTTAEVARLEHRKSALLRQHKERWLAPLRELKASTNLHGEFSRGFFDCTKIDLATFLERGDELWRHCPVSSLWFGEIGRLATRLSRCPHLARLRGLRLNGTDAQVRTVLGSPHLANLRSLSLGGKSFDDEGVQDLASLPALPPLTSLTVSSDRVTGATLPALLRRLGQLEWLSIYSSKFDVACLGEVLAALPEPGRLRSLSFDSVPLGATGMRALARARLGGLTDLWLRGCSLDAEAIEALAGASHLTAVSELYIDENPSLGEAGARALAAWPGLRAVRKLNFDDAEIGPAGVGALANSPHLGPLEELWLRHCRVGDAGCEALAASRLPSTLRQLELDSNGVTDAGATAIAAAPFTGLRSLSIDYNAVGDAGAAALAASPHLRTLRGLTVGDPVSLSGAIRLATQLPRLNFLIAKGAWWAWQIEVVREVAAEGGSSEAIAAAVEARLKQAREDDD